MIRVAIDFFSQCQSPKNCAIGFFSQCQSPKNCAIDFFSQCQSPKNCAIGFFSQCQSPKNCAIGFFSQCQSPKNCAIDFFSQCQSPKNCAIGFFSQCQSPKNCGSGPLPPLNSLQQQRQRQIESLKAAHSSLAEIQKDVEYRIPFTVNNATISVNILLPPQFPQEKPVVSVYPPVGHHLVDSNNGTMVTSPLITNFGMHSDLGKVIQSLLDEFWKSPPVLMSGPTGFPYNMYKPSGMPPYPTQSFHYGPRPVGLTPPPMPHAGVEGAHGHGPPWAAAPVYGLITDLPLPVPTADSQAGLNGHMYKMPEIPETFPELSEMSVSQLKDMSEQEDVLLELFVCLPQLKQVTTDKEELVNSIVDMAKKNLQLEPQLEGRRQEMLFKYEQLTQNKSAFETKMQRQHDISESCSLSALQARLKVAAHQAEEESEETAESFLEGKTDIDDFLANFMEKRTLCHSRRAKEEKLQQSINTHGQFPSSH